MSTPCARSTLTQPDSLNDQPSRSFAQSALIRYWNSPLPAIFSCPDQLVGSKSGKWAEGDLVAEIVWVVGKGLSRPGGPRFRSNTMIGDAFRSRTDETEATEVAIAAALNRMIEFGCPNYVRIA